MTTKVLDTFTEGSDTALGSHTPDTDIVGSGWTADTGVAVDSTLDKVDFTTVTRGAYIPAGATGDMIVKATFNARSGDNRLELQCKRNTNSLATRDCYRLNCQPGVTTLVLDEINSGSASNIATDSSPVASLNNSSDFVYELRYAAGGALSVYIDGVAETGVTGTDVSDTHGALTSAGFAHFKYVASGGTLDQFEVYDAVPAAGSATPHGPFGLVFHGPFGGPI